MREERELYSNVTGPGKRNKRIKPPGNEAPAAPPVAHLGPQKATVMALTWGIAANRPGLE
jgi:hypothetical protein